jgi:hypothetical protein
MNITINSHNDRHDVYINDVNIVSFYCMTPESKQIISHLLLCDSNNNLQNLLNFKALKNIESEYIYTIEWQSYSTSKINIPIEHLCSAKNFIKFLQNRNKTISNE